MNIEIGKMNMKEGIRLQYGRERSKIHKLSVVTLEKIKSFSTTVVRKDVVLKSLLGLI